MHIENFKIFADLAETGSFSKAARMNGITQSAVSQQLRAMERAFNVLIVDRTQKQLHLTPEGRRLYEGAKRLLGVYDDMRARLLAMKKIVAGTLNIETIYSIGLHELPPFLRAFSGRFPEVRIRLEYRKAAQIYDDVLHGACDVGMVAFAARHPHLEIAPFKTDRMVAICAPRHPLARKKSASLAEIAKCKFVAFETGTPTRKALDAAFRKERLSPDTALEFDNVETIKRAVEIDSGVAVVPEATVRQECAQGSLVRVPLRGVVIPRPLALVYRRGESPSPALAAFIPLVSRPQKDSIEN